MKLASLLLFALVAILLPLQARAVVLELRDKQDVAGENLTLNDLLSSSQGVSADDLATVVATAPDLGKSDAWTRDRIEAALPSSLKQQVVTWNGAMECVINRPAVSFGPAEVKQLITAELGHQLPADSDFAVLEMPDANPFLIPAGAVDTHVDLTAGSMRNEWGEASLQFRIQGQVAVTKSVRFHWAYTRLVWQSSSHIAGGEDLNQAGFQQIEVNVLKIPGLLQPATDFPSGKVAAHPIQPGKILMDNDWVEPVLVARNDLVTITYAHHGISITVQAKALANGTRDQVIAVQNLTSHKIFNARVVDERSLVYDE